MKAAFGTGCWAVQGSPASSVLELLIVMSSSRFRATEQLSPRNQSFAWNSDFVELAAVNRARDREEGIFNALVFYFLISSVGSPSGRTDTAIYQTKTLAITSHPTVPSATCNGAHAAANGL